MGTGGEVETHGGERHRYDMEIVSWSGTQRVNMEKKIYRASDIELIFREREGA